MTSCILYLRLSDGRNENGSFADREAKLRQRAHLLGWTVTDVVIENDMMNGSKSASAFKRRKVRLPDGSTVMRVIRPGFRRILDDLSAGRVDALLAEDLDRTMRDPRDAEDLIDIIRERKAYADSLSGSLKFTAGGTDAEIMMARIAVTVAHKSSSDTARRVADARERKAAKGESGGGRRPYGFTADGVTVDPQEAGILRNCANQILAGVSLKAVARDLRQRDIPTVTGTRWTAESLRDVLLKPRNAGILVHNGTEAARLPGDPILSADIWQAVRDKLTDPSRTTAGRAACWLGTGIYRCVCGAAMEIQRGTGRAASYRCDADDPRRTGDIHVRRNAEALDSFVTAVVVARLSQPDAVDLFAKPTAPGVDVEALRREATALRARKAKLAADYGSGVLDDVEYAAAKRGNKAKLDRVEAALAAVTDRSPLDGIAGAQDVAAVWQRLSLGQQREIVNLLMTVTVLPSVRKGRGFDPDGVAIKPR